MQKIIIIIIIIIMIIIIIITITIITIRKVKSGEETSGNPRADTERSPWKYVRTIRLIKASY